MANAADIIAQAGIGLTRECVQAAALEKTPISIAATILDKESNGKNIWGHDTNNTGGSYTPGGLVTQINYLHYRSLMRTGIIPRNGVGPCQCTSAQYQDTADELGGCWNPIANMRSGFRGMMALINRYGIRQGARHYNGSGPRAEAYGADFEQIHATWEKRLAGATNEVIVSEDDELNADEKRMLSELYDQVTGKGYKGWPTWDGGTNEQLSMIDYLRRSNVESRQLFPNLNALHQKIDAINHSGSGNVDAQAVANLVMQSMAPMVMDAVAKVLGQGNQGHADEIVRLIGTKLGKV